MPVSEALLAELRDFPVVLRARGGEIARARWAERPSPREFALVEHACHLRDFERKGVHVRIARVLAEDAPVLADFNGLAVAAERNYLAAEAEPALDAFAQARAATVERLAVLPDAALARAATLEGVGPVTLARLVELLAEHDASHRAELERLVRDLR